jgi:hypothetical protein
VLGVQRRRPDIFAFTGFSAPAGYVAANADLL